MKLNVHLLWPEHISRTELKFSSDGARSNSGIALEVNRHEVLDFFLRNMTSHEGSDAILEAESAQRCHTGDWN